MSSNDSVRGRRQTGPVGVRAVAARAGVAQSSVSRVLSGHPDVSDVMRHRVLDAVAALGYEPDMLAQSLRRGATMTVGFVVGDISNPLLSQIALGAEVRLREAGYSMLVMNSRNDPALDATHIQMLRQRRVDGLLLSLADEAAAPTLQALQRSNAPCVLVDRDPAKVPNASAVLSDHQAGLTAAIDHLATLGHNRIALINGNPRVRPAKERAAAARRFARSAGNVEIVVRSGAFSPDHGRDAAGGLLAGPDRPTAVVAGGNQILTGVLAAVRQARLKIPSDLSLVTCDDVALAEFLQPPLATISRDTFEIGRIAAELLLERLGGQPPRSATLPTSFRPARSCAPPS